MTPHIEALKDEIAKIVIMPGDPLRAEYIAKKYLKDAKLVNKVRGIYAFTGFYNDIKVTIMASGMGIPSMGIYSNELFKFYDVDYIIRVGTAGSYLKDLDLYETVLLNEIYSESSYGKVAFNDSNDTISTSFKINEAIIKTAQELNIDLKCLKGRCSEAFYECVSIDEIVSKYNCAVVEMESFALQQNAIHNNKFATTLLTIADQLITLKHATSEERQLKFDDMIHLALESLKYL